MASLYVIFFTCVVARMPVLYDIVQTQVVFIPNDWRVYGYCLKLVCVCVALILSEWHFATFI